jgi:hypothetical protein
MVLGYEHSWHNGSCSLFVLHLYKLSKPTACCKAIDKWFTGLDGGSITSDRCYDIKNITTFLLKLLLVFAKIWS